MTYNFLEHTADIKFQATGETIEQAFTSSADALNQTIRGDIKILEQKEKTIQVNGKDKEALLYNFLEEFLFLLDAKDFLVAKVKNLIIQDNTLTATITGDKASNYQFTNDVKAITYNQMFVKQIKNKFQIQVVLDV